MPIWREEPWNIEQNTNDWCRATDRRGGQNRDRGRDRDRAKIKIRELKTKVA